jgi:serine/threonine protein kinase/tetratricopeptide (TPR) repeat protein
VILEGFRVARELGSGSYGRVALVENERSGRRYAVKVIQVADPSAADRFMLEAQRWVDLPEHANIASCYFTRAADDGLAIFSEYVEGGSLADAIASGKLYDGAAEDRIFKVATGAARGLAAAHRRGLLHLDVKPANVLLADDDVAKICDFGLATGHELGPEARLQMEALVEYMTDIPEAEGVNRELIGQALMQHLLSPKPDDPVSVAAGEGQTVEYASPEQLFGGELGEAADAWSWAATVVEMLAGARSWPRGPDVGIALDGLLAGHKTPRVPVAPELAEVLRSCLHTDPSVRPSLEDVVSHLAGDAQSPSDEPAAAAAVSVSARWTDPRAWLQLAYETAGLEPRDAVAFWPKRVGSRKARGLEDLRALMEARRVLEPAAATEEQRLQLGMLRGDIGQVRESLDDRAAAIDEYRAARAIFASVPDQGASLEAQVLTRLAIALRSDGDIEAALDTSREAVRIARGLEAPDPGTLAAALLTYGNTTRDNDDRLTALDEAATLAEEAGADELRARIAVGYAGALAAVGSPDAADAWTRADGLLESLMELGRPEITALKGRALLGRAALAKDLHERRDQAIAAAEQLERVVAAPGVTGVAGDLGEALFYAGMAEEHLGRPQEALARYAASAAHLEHAVEADGRDDLADEYAQSSDHQATLMRMLSDPAGAVEVGRRAVELWVRLTAREGPAAWALRLADARTKLAAHLDVNGDIEEATAQVEEALRLLEGAEDSAERDRLRASAHMERATHHRKAGRLQQAAEDYDEALRVLENADEGEELRFRARVLLNLSNTLEDAGHYQEALAAVRAAIDDLGTLGPDVPLAADDLAGAYKNAANKLHKLGDYESARQCAVLALERFTELAARGRSDVAEDLATLQAVYALTLERLFDVPGAIAATEAAIEAFRNAQNLDPQVREASFEMLDMRLDALHRLERTGPDDVLAWVPDIRMKLDTGGMLMREGAPDKAILFFADALTTTVSLLDRAPDDALVELLAESGLSLTIAAYHDGRPLLVWRGGRYGIDARRAYVEAGHRDELDRLAAAYSSVAAALVVLGEDARGADYIAEMREVIGAWDAELARTTEDETRQMIAEALGGR